MSNLAHLKNQPDITIICTVCFCKTSQLSLKSICDGVSFGKTVSPHACNCTKKDAITGVSCSDMFYKVDLLKNCKKLTGKHLCRSFFFLIKLHTIVPATLLNETSGQMFYCEFFKIVKSILQNFSGECLWFQCSFLNR